MDVFFICLFVISAIGSFLSPSEALGMITLAVWVISAIYLAFRYRVDVTDFINKWF